MYTEYDYEVWRLSYDGRLYQITVGFYEMGAAVAAAVEGAIANMMPALQAIVNPPLAAASRQKGH